MITLKEKMDCLVLVSNNPNELLKVSNTILDRYGTTKLEEKLKELGEAMLNQYDECSDMVLLDIFGEEFKDDEFGHIQYIWDFWEEGKTPESRVETVVRCYLQWVLQFNMIFPKYHRWYPVFL